MPKKMCMEMKVRKTVALNASPFEVAMPSGVVGVIFVYESKKAAREILGKKADLKEIAFQEAP